MRSRLLAGTLTLLPLLATLYLLAWAYRLLGGWAEGLLGLWGLEVAESLRMALPLATLTAFLGTAYLVGFLAERHLGRKLIAWVERPFLLLPGVRDIYRATGQIAQSLMGSAVATRWPWPLGRGGWSCASMGTWTAPATPPPPPWPKGASGEGRKVRPPPWPSTPWCACGFAEREKGEGYPSPFCL